MKYIVFLFVFLSVTGCTLNNPESKRTAPVVSPDISSSSIICVSEDAHGYLWFGTTRGLNRYNGTDFHQYTHSDEDSLSLPQNMVTRLYLDSHNRFWVGTSAGMSLYSNRDAFLRCEGLEESLLIEGIVESSQGEIFTCTPLALYSYDEGDKRFVQIPGDLNTKNTNDEYLLIDGQDKLWWGAQDLVRIVDSRTKKEVDTLSFSFDVKSALVDKQRDEIWFCGEKDVLLFDVRTLQQKMLPDAFRSFYQKESPYVFSLFFLDNADLLFSTPKGVYYYDRKHEQICSQQDAAFPFERPAFPVNQFYQDHKGNLWYISANQGFQFCSKQHGMFGSLPNLVNAFANKNVVSIAPGGEGRYWFYSLPDELYLYQSRDKQLDRISLNETFFDITLITRPLLYEDQQGYLWIRVSDNRLLKCSYDKGKLQPGQSFLLNSVNSISEAPEGDTFYIGQYDTNDPLSIIKGNTKQNEVAESAPVTCMIPLKDGRMVAATLRNGLSFIEKDRLVLSPLAGAHLHSLLNRGIDFHALTLYEDPNRCVWLGTLGNGLLCYDLKTGMGNFVQELRMENILSILEDDKGFLWLGTDNGLAQYDKASRHVKMYYKKDGISSNQFGIRSAAKMADGTLLFGGTQGLTVVNPNVEASEDSVSILFEDLRVFNDLVVPEKQGSIDRRMVFKPEVNLSHNQTGFSISFSSLNFGGTVQYTYQYLLEGVDKVWVNAPVSQSASYANVSPGHYTFRVRLMSNDLKVVKGESALEIYIHPAPWNTWWAWLLYLLLVVAVLAVIVRAYWNTRKEHARAEQERQEKERELHVNQMNMNFFANVSHEFRTPLTVISGPLTQLSDEELIPEHDRNLLRIINRSVSRMLQLVNQMMDFNKLEDDALKLQVTHQDLVPLLREQLEFFALNAQEKGIQLTSKGLDDYFLSWIDGDKLMKILNNLLGNAMKYSPSGSKVRLEMDTLSREDAIRIFALNPDDAASQYVQISVIDNGPGIPEEQRNKIFDRFYQFENQQKGQFSWGTGIGLYYVRRLVQLHHGAIKALDNPDCQGSCFSFILPLASSAYTEGERMPQPARQNEKYPLREVTEQAASHSCLAEPDGKGMPRLLIVDDDVEIIHYMKLLLAGEYDVVCRFEAETAHKTLQEEGHFDLIISDLMMPGTNGIQFCSQIKADEQHCHIPFILVTAKNSSKSQIEGIEAGAIAYLPKPFDPAYLKALIKSLLANRDRTQKQLVESTQTEQVEEDALTVQDKAFMTKLYTLMEEELDNPDLDINRITELLHVSRSKLYYKIKGLTGENPGSFFRHYKLNRAAEMLKEGKYNVSEIAILTGYNTVQHFSTSFKKQFGCAPSEFK